jgi:hypothetical protein
MSMRMRAKVITKLPTYVCILLCLINQYGTTVSFSAVFTNGDWSLTTYLAKKNCRLIFTLRKRRHHFLCMSVNGGREPGDDLLFREYGVLPLLLHLTFVPPSVFSQS